MIARLLARLADWATPAPADLGIPEPQTTVRECRADDLAVLTEADLLGLTAHMDLAPSRPHEGTAAERVGGVR